jgi:hypothetical protein
VNDVPVLFGTVYVFFVSFAQTISIVHEDGSFPQTLPAFQLFPLYCGEDESDKFDVHLGVCHTPDIHLTPPPP